MTYIYSFIDSELLSTLNQTAMCLILTPHCFSRVIGGWCFCLATSQLTLTSGISTSTGVLRLRSPPPHWLLPLPSDSRHSGSGPHRALPPPVSTGYYSQCLANQIECSGEPCVFALAFWKSGTSRRGMDFTHLSGEFRNRIEAHVALGTTVGQEMEEKYITHTTKTCLYFVGLECGLGCVRLQGTEEGGCVSTTH